MVEHCDEESLALMSLGETPDPRDDAHVQECSRCQSRLDQLSAVVSVTRTLTPEDRPQSPPDSVWAGIASELELSTTSASVTSLSAARARRGGGRWWLMAAAAAVLGIVVGSAVTLGVQGSGSGAGSAGTVIAQGQLAPIGDSGLQGTAAVHTVDGQSVLVVSVPKLPSAGAGYYEVWMATPDTSTMVAMGTLNPGQEGRFPIPSGLDPKEYPVVDVSVEQFDGDNTHSATSLVRGRLSA